ncbi:hypothetical protein Q31a_58380 [Aureliella helgolandensis]|uniref:Uncharacterized protein n=1 Tax=Aureliella helgolandensis TaxID=2527968 RepID=A0A518GFS3_9BACT|nr:hypothetical protein Q31a_58380 [Aureliella helgolandensis]
MQWGAGNAPDPATLLCARIVVVRGARIAVQPLTVSKLRSTQLSLGTWIAFQCIVFQVQCVVLSSACTPDLYTGLRAEPSLAIRGNLIRSLLGRFS